MRYAVSLLVVMAFSGPACAAEESPVDLCVDGAPVAAKLIAQSFGLISPEESTNNKITINKNSITADRRDASTGNVRCSMDWLFDEEAIKSSSGGDSQESFSMFPNREQQLVSTMYHIMNMQAPRAAYTVKPTPGDDVLVTLIRSDIH